MKNEQSSTADPSQIDHHQQINVSAVILSLIVWRESNANLLSWHESLNVNSKRDGIQRVVGQLIILSFIGVGLLGACSDEGEQDGGNFQVGNQSETEPDLDAGPDADADGEGGDQTSGGDVEGDADDGEGSPCEDVSCGDDQSCVEGECVDDDAAQGVDCDDAYQLGSLNPDDITSVILDPSNYPNSLDTGCSIDNDSPQAVFSFRVDEAMGVTARMAHSEHLLVKELRADACDDAEATQWCSHNDQGWIAEPDREYFLIVEAREGWMVGEFLLELEADTLDCTPPDGKWCESETVRGECVGGHTERVLECGHGCDEELGTCLGDRCDNPIVVHDTVTVTGEHRAYQHHIDFEDSPTCSTNQTAGLSTVGAEVVFSLPGLSAGQRVHAEIEGQSFAVIGVMEDCQDGASDFVCTTADSQDGELNWEVSEGGDYFVVINPRTASSDEFTYTVSIEN